MKKLVLSLSLVLAFSSDRPPRSGTSAVLVSGPWLICRLMGVEVATSLPSPGLMPHTRPDGTTLL